jgi:hypothetical protein
MRFARTAVHISCERVPGNSFYNPPNTLKNIYNMKKTIIIVLAALISISGFSQLSNTRWKGTIKGDNPRNVILDFKKDTVLLYTVSDSEMVERMTFAATAQILP